MHYNVVVDPQILERYPHYSLLLIYAEGLKNGPGNEESDAILREAERDCRARLHSMDLSTQPYIAAWREAYRSFGSKPKKYPCSVEALLSRTLKGQDLPNINLLVDLYNTISIKYVVPAGGEDWDKLASDLRLTFAKGDEPFFARQEGKEATTYPDPGEVIYADKEGVTCRRWNWRQGLRTALTESSTSAYFILDRLAPMPVDEIQQAGEELVRLIKRFQPDSTLTTQLIGEQ